VSVMKSAVLGFLETSPESLSHERLQALLECVEAELQPLAGLSKDFPDEDLWDLGGCIALISPQDRRISVVRVGDFRIVRVRDHRLEVLAREHTLRAQLESQGQVVPDAVSNVIVAHLGGRLAIPGDAITTAEVEVGDRLAIFEHPNTRSVAEDLALLLSVGNLRPEEAAAKTLDASVEHSVACAQLPSRAVCIVDIVG